MKYFLISLSFASLVLAIPFNPNYRGQSPAPVHEDVDEGDVRVPFHLGQGLNNARGTAGSLRGGYGAGLSEANAIGQANQGGVFGDGIRNTNTVPQDNAAFPGAGFGGGIGNNNAVPQPDGVSLGFGGEWNSNAAAQSIAAALGGFGSALNNANAAVQANAAALSNGLSQAFGLGNVFG